MRTVSVSERCYGYLKEICRAPVRLLIVGNFGPFTEVMKCDSAVNPSLTLPNYVKSDVRWTQSVHSKAHLQNVRGMQVNVLKPKFNCRRPRNLLQPRISPKVKHPSWRFGRRPEESRHRKWSEGKREESLERRGCLLWQTASHHTAEVREK